MSLLKPIPSSILNIQSLHMFAKTFKALVIAGLIIVSFEGYGQYYPEKVSRKAMALYNQGLEKANDGDFKEGIRLLESAVKTDAKFMDAYLSIAGMYGELKNYGAAIENYIKAKAIDPAYFGDYNLPFAINLAGKGDFPAAITAIDEFINIPSLNERSRLAAEYRKKSFQFAIDYAKEKPLGNYKFEPRNLGENVNSRYSEYFPTLTIDGKELVFTRRVGNTNEDFYSASRHDTSWSVANALPGNINSPSNEGAQNISQDGQWLIFTGCNFPEGFGSCDLYISYLTNSGWSAPENLGNKINTEAWETAPSLSPDKRELYFTSNRAGGFGGSDIYISKRLANGSWSEPQNAGPEINTKGDESCPFIHADNQTLYFTSNGHLGYGGEDLFLVRKNADGSWSKAINLGYPINTIENEGSLSVASDGTTAYYASDRSDSRGGLDLYSFQLRDDIRPARTLWVKGKVFDKKTSKGLPSSVELTDLATQRTVSSIQTDGTGSYLITLPVGKEYAFNVNRRGYLFYSENFSLIDKATDSTYNIDIPLQPIETNATIVLRNIFFDVNKFVIKPESYSELDKIVALLKENPTLIIQINGHTDNVGKAADNLKLSNERADAVVKYLVSKGIASARLSSKGFGATVAVADNNTDAGRAQNRRTELKVISQ
jgi:outer membrane protein OmpA-like peptidoglycan-associated protein/Tol biopolymer transport system component